MAMYEIPTEAERPALFRLTKQRSAYTTWAFIGGYYEDWVEYAKSIHSVALDPDDGEPALNESEMRLFLLGHAAFVDALAKLHAGDRSVFKWMGYGTGEGYFCEAYRLIAGWQTTLYGRGSYEFRQPIRDTLYWPEFERRLDDLIAVWSNGGTAIQPRYLDVPADMTGMEYLHGTYQTWPGDPPATPLPEFVALMAQNLPPVPKPETETLIKTGEEIPCYGIWEPVKITRKTSILDTFKRPEPFTEKDFQLDGCMNYLHEGSPAPTIAFEGDTSRGEGRPTTWRLLWKDDRYLDGSIPEEEKEYVFYTPPQAAPVMPSASTAGTTTIITAQTGEPASKSGIWAVVDDLAGRSRFNAGDILPQHKGRDVSWIWVEA